MNALEQVAFGWQCLLGARRACRSPAVWGPWVALFALQALGVFCCWWAAHPLVSWFAAPVLRAWEGDAALRYPELFRRLPGLARDAGLATGVLLLPVAAGISARLFERQFRALPAAAGAAWSEGLRRSPALLVAALPVSLAAVGLQAMLHALPHVRLSGLARSLAPPAADAALLFVRIACAYAAALVVLGGRSGFGALTGIPSTWARGFLPAAVAALLLAPAAGLASATVTASLALVDRGAPEWVVAAVLLRAGTGAALGLLASGAFTLAWLGGVSESAHPHGENA